MIHGAVVSTFNRTENAIRRRKNAILNSNYELGYFSDQIITYIARSGIMGWI